MERRKVKCWTDGLRIAKIPMPKDDHNGVEESPALPQTLVRIPIQHAETVQKEAEAAEAAAGE